MSRDQEKKHLRRRPEGLHSPLTPGRQYLIVAALLAGLVGMALLVNFFEDTLLRNLVPVVAVYMAGCVISLVKRAVPKAYTQEDEHLPF